MRFARPRARLRIFPGSRVDLPARHHAGLARARAGTGRNGRSSCGSTVRRRSFMTISLVHLQPIIALIAGILILLMPRLLNYIVAIYLIVIGVAGLIR